MKAPARHKRIGSRMLWQTGAIILLAVALGIVINQIRPARLPFVGDWSPEAQLTLESGKSLVISLDDAHDNFISGKGVFLDARAPEAYNEGHIQGARNLPWEAVDEYMEKVTAQVSQDALIIAYCDGESCALSKDLALELFYMGYENVRVLVNGWSLWVEHQLPISKGGE